MEAQSLDLSNKHRNEQVETVNISWKPPNAGCVKINYDASYRKGGSYGAFGFII